MQWHAVECHALNPCADAVSLPSLSVVSGAAPIVQIQVYMLDQHISGISKAFKNYCMRLLSMQTLWAELTNTAGQMEMCVVHCIVMENGTN